MSSADWPTTTHELLKLAAKAVGIKLDYRQGSDAYYYDDPETGREEWHPHQNDGQALRLAVQLGIDVLPGKGVEAWTRAISATVFADERPSIDRFASTRRAIVRCAAELGKAMPG